MLEIITLVVHFILFYYFLLSIWYTSLLIISFQEVIRIFNESKLNAVIRLVNQDHLIPITAVIPAFNESKRITNTLYSILNSDYQNTQIIVVNDGSTDDMMDMLKKTFDLKESPRVIKNTFKTKKILHTYQSVTYPQLVVLDKEKGDFDNGADALNAGLNACQTPIMLTIDADTVLEPDSLSRLLFSYISKTNCVAVSGAVYVLNDNAVERGRMLEHHLSKGFVAAIQSVEYFRSFLYGRAGLNVLGGALCYPGAFSLFETLTLKKIGGFDIENYSYDAEITTKIHDWMRTNHQPYHVNHSPNAFCWTEVPGTFKAFWKQRNKWQRGMLRTTFKHIHMLFNPAYGVVGLITFPAYVFFEVGGPVIEFISYVLFAVLFFFEPFDMKAFFWFMLLAWGFITFLSIAMVFLNLISFNKYDRWSDTFRVIWLVFAEMFGFRQYRAFCCAMATIRYSFNRLLGRPL